MPNMLRKMFLPTEEEKQELYGRMDEFTRKKYEKHGQCCATCRYLKYVQESPYYDYTTCELDASLEFEFGHGGENHKCVAYEFVGYLKGENV